MAGGNMFRVKGMIAWQPIRVPPAGTKCFRNDRSNL